MAAVIVIGLLAFWLLVLALWPWLAGALRILWQSVQGENSTEVRRGRGNYRFRENEQKQVQSSLESVEFSDAGEAEKWLQMVRQIITSHKSSLIAEKRRHTTADPYGNTNSSAWSDCPGLIALRLMNYFDNPDILDASIRAGHFDTGLFDFWKSVILPRVGGTAAFVKGWRRCKTSLREFQCYDNWVEFIYQEIENVIAGGPEPGFSLPSGQREVGLEYETYCMQLLQQTGWHVVKTPASGDQGVDLIATNQSGLSVCIQCKCYSKPVGNAAVQEVCAGKSYYSVAHAAVVSNSGFTKSAVDLAVATGVVLLDTEDLSLLCEKFLA